MSAKFVCYKQKVASKNPDPVPNGVTGYQVVLRPDGQVVVMRVGSGLSVSGTRGKQAVRQVISRDNAADCTCEALFERCEHVQ